jgi:hypothetical protein
MPACAARIDPDIDVMGMFNLYFIHKLALLTVDFVALHYIKKSTDKEIGLKILLYKFF